jgi:integrase
MKKNLTDAFLRALKKPASGRVEFADLSCRGLEFRITKAGNESWSYRYRAPKTGKLARVTIGPYPDIGLADARLKADELRRRVADGDHPSEIKRQTRRDAPMRTFETLADRYLKEYARRKKRSADEDERNLNLHVLPKWKDRDYGDIRRRDVIELIEGLIAAKKPVLANRIHSLVSVVFSFAIDADLVESNPCSRLKKRGAERVGERVLTDPEIRLFWPRCVETPLSRTTGLGLRFALLTGARIGEVAGITKGELERLDDPERAIWTIPGNRTKNGKDHIVPLAPQALAIVRDLVPMTPHAYARAMSRMAAELKPDRAIPALKSWKASPPTPHDLRRTFRTRLPQLGIPADIRDRLMNHISGDVGTKHYDRYSYLSEKREALVTWDAALAAILEGHHGVV